MNTPSPKGWALALVLVGVIIALTASTASLVSGDRSLMGIAATGFAVQFLGWVVNGRQNGGRR
ncbi:hypothetical protein [Streptomyces sp. HD]|uniref:hypothetical protein n=1 Tax=Streptomyces sp. HD TaxID=3020892 RepID=UPI00232EF76E|nr:hypothetical protein [Streptomyces sp. HD]MDC0765678.1 hypothetical protein [Streptomyces sp. HD]